MKKITKGVIAAATASAVGGYLALIAPRLSMRNGTSKFIGKVFAHRGIYGGDVRENSLEAFEAAMENGYGIELDVRVSADGQAMVYHDPSLTRLFGENSLISELDADTLRREYDIPTLKDALDMINGAVPLLIEIKCDGSDISLCPIAMDVLKDYEGDYAIQSFNPLVLRWMKKYHPDVIRGQLSTSFTLDGMLSPRYFAIENLFTNCVTKPDFISYNHKYAGNISLNVCRKLYKVPTFAWTLRTSEQWNHCADRFDSYICEDLPKKKKRQ
ncbi:MAG: glycerophosphodiester phosphodiesterase [Clostridia bacterium]|nr:glycerophosphodiester phosphodiesterase [Clostridia bacterium]